MIHCLVDREYVTLTGPFTLSFLTHLSTLTGKKIWPGAKTVIVEATVHNLGQLRKWPDIEIEHKQYEIFADDVFEIEGHGNAANYQPKMTLRDFQKECLGRSWDQLIFAIFAEMGLGKTALMIANIGMLSMIGAITGVLVISPKGVHEQWLEDEFPKHADPNFSWIGHVWTGNPIKIPENHNYGCEVLSMNTDALRVRIVKRKVVYISPGLEAAEQFLRKHKGRALIVLDESHKFKDYKSQRTKAVWRLKNLATYRRIMTGTPIARNLVDAWAQFFFLDENIFGESMTAFRSKFCEMAGFNDKEIVGHRNIEEFYATIAPYTYRVTKDEALDLPPKIYVQRPYEMSDATRKHYKSMKETWITRFDNGEIKDASNGLVAMLRLQQILCGYLEREDGTIESIGGGERIAELLDIIEQTSGPTIIWSRFTEDIERIAKVLSDIYGEDQVVTYYGGVDRHQRKSNKHRFTNLEARFFIGNIGISAGLDGLQVAKTMIFYACDFDAIHRWQSEDRGHRMGMTGSLTIFDIIAKGSVDRPIQKNLGEKKSLSNLSLDQIRQAIAAD